MKQIKWSFLSLLFIGGSIPQDASSNIIALIDQNGESTLLDVNPTDQFSDVLSQIQAYYAAGSTEEPFHDHGHFSSEGISLSGPRFNFEISHAGVAVRSKKINIRDYNVSVAKQEKKELHYILTTLANNSLLSIGTSKSSLKKAGDRIDHLHPFRFLMTIFNDEELKAAVHAIRDRGHWIWEGFIDGITGSLKEEAARDNVLQFTSDFAKKVKIDPALIEPSLQHGKWTEFVNVLIDKIPREIDPNRYDM